MYRCVLLLFAFLALSSPRLLAASCGVAPPHTPSEAEAAFLHGDYDKAASLFQSQLQQDPNDAGSAVGLVRVLLRQQKVDEAADAARKGLASEPKSAALMVALGEVQYRQGAPWLVRETVNDALKIDACNARLHLLASRIYELDSMYASAAKELKTAHALDPHDPAIRSMWLETLPLAQRITELEAYLASPTGDDPEYLHRTTMYLESLKKREAEPHKPCRLVSESASTEIPFMSLMRDANHIRAFGLDVKFNGHSARLQIDTGAGGLLVSRSVAEHAGLKPFSATEMSGIGSQGAKSGYTAYADSIQIGSLEFHDCVVQVLDARNVLDSDGLIGMDVFSRFLITLDYPMRKLALGPLPPRPDQTVPQTLSLATNNNAEDEGAGKPAPTASGEATAAQPAAAPRPPRGPYDRYVAPEMKGYFPIYRVGHNLLISTNVNKVNRKLFILDTGSWTTTISTAAASEVSKVHREDQLHVHGISGKVDQAYSADNVTLEFADVRQPAREIVSLDTAELSKRMGVDISGFIGATTLDQLTTHIDYRDGLVKFDYDPNRGYRPK